MFVCSGEINMAFPQVTVIPVIFVVTVIFVVIAEARALFVLVVEERVELLL